MRNSKLIYDDLSSQTANSERFKETYEKLLQLQNLGTVSGSDLSLEEIKFLINCASVFSFSSDKFKQLAYKIAVILSEKYSNSEYPALTGPIQYIMICSGQLPVVKKFVTDGNVDYFSLYSESGIPFNPLLFDEVLYKQAENLIQFERNSRSPLYFTDFQRKGYGDLSAGKSISVSAPTSAGKSFLLIAYLAKKLRENDKINIVYIVPTRALIAQVVRDVRAEMRKFNVDDVALCSRSKIALDFSSHQKRILVLTQERFHNLLFDSEFSENIDILIVDEAQKVSDQSRGILLEEVIEEALKRYKPLQTIFITPFSKNPDKFAKMFHLNEFKVEKTTLSPVSQNILKLDVSTKQFSLSLSTTKLEANHDIEIDNGLIPKPESAKYSGKDWELLWSAKKFGGESNIVYCNFPSDCVKYAMRFISSQESVELSSSVGDAIKYLKENIHEKYFLIDCLRKGVGYHHGKMPIQIRNIVEELFRNRELKFLFCTSTLLEGVNLPAQNIFITKPLLGKSNPLNRLSFWNLAGRAGRLLQDYYGNIFCINIDNWKGYHPDPDDVEHEIESVLESAIIERDKEQIENLKKLYTEFKIKDLPLERAITKFLIKSMKDGESDFVQNLLLRNPNFNEDSLEIIKNEINEIARSIKIPPEMIQKNSTINPFELQGLLEYFRNFPNMPIPLHPRNPNFYSNLEKIIQVIDLYFLEKKDDSFKYYSYLINRWINETSMSELIKGKLQKSKAGTMTPEMINQGIENIFSEINDKIRFSYQKYLKCYIDLLFYHYSECNLNPEKIHENLPLFLEFGTYQPNTIILQSVGLSRPAAIAVSRLVKVSLISEVECVQWIRMNKDWLSPQISPILFSEIEKIT